jgi:uncharacterized RDD family membrane protein YckC
MSEPRDRRAFVSAPVWRRALATLIDLLVPLTAWVLATWLVIASDPAPLTIAPWNLFDQIVDYLHDRPGRAAFSLTLLVLAQVGWPLAFRDATPGKRALEVALVDARGVPPSRGRRLVWALVRVPSLALAGLGAWWALVDPERRTLHDRVAGMWLVMSDDAGVAGERQV